METANTFAPQPPAPPCNALPRCPGTDILLVVTPAAPVNEAWVADVLASCTNASIPAVVMTPSPCADPLDGVRRLMRHFVHDLLQQTRGEYGSELRCLFPDHEAFANAVPLEDIALPSSERRLSRESERLFRLVNGIAAMLNARVGTGPGCFGELWLLVPDLLQMDRLSLHVLHQIRRFRHARIRIVAGISQADLAALQSMGDHGELQDPLAIRRRFAKDFLEIGRYSVYAGPLGASPPGTERDRAKAAVLSLDNIARAIEWGQYDQALLALESVTQRDFAWYKAVGLTHAYLGQYMTAAAAYAQADEVAPTPAQRAEAYVYLALLSSKRNSQHRAAQQLVDIGRQCVAGLSDEHSVIESGWLSNVAALAHFSEGRQAEAMALCKNAYLSLKPHKGSDALHLKINLVSNLSVVYESMGRLSEALAVWETFSQFLAGSTSALFAKIYHYRVAGLLLKAGDAGKAEASYRRSYEEATRVHDRFHLMYIAYDLGVLCARRGAWAEALEWFERSRRHAGAVAEHERVEMAAAAAGLARHHCGDVEGAKACWQALLDDAPCSTGMRGTLDRLLAWAAGTTQPAAPGTFANTVPDDLLKKLLTTPGSKLGRPFHPLHIPPLKTASAATAGASR